jgi:hypothetical protein
LIRYLYQETTEEEKKEIETALLRDSELQRSYNELVSLVNEINDAALEPSSRTVLNIMSYSRNWQKKPE